MGFLIYIGLTRLPPTWHRNYLFAQYASFVALMAVSRIYVSDHWPSDVVGGVWLGTIFLVWMILFTISRPGQTSWRLRARSKPLAVSNIHLVT